MRKLISFFKTPIIEFLCDEADFGVIPEPVHASKRIPEWFKKIPLEMANGAKDSFGAPAGTAKQCPPMIQGLTLGFVIPLAGDVTMRVNTSGKLMEASVNPELGPLIEFHDIHQLGGKSSPTYPGPAIKFINRWVIKTAPGYSVLITPCLNSTESRFTCLSAVVDTDKYHNEINFPGIWHKVDGEEILTAGTPLVTVIPFKRSDMPKTAPVRVRTKKENEKYEKIRRSVRSRRKVYANMVKENKAKDNV